MTSVCPLAQEKVWLDRSKYIAAENKYYERLAKLPKGNPNSSSSGQNPTSKNPKKSSKSKDPEIKAVEPAVAEPIVKSVQSSANKPSAPLPAANMRPFIMSTPAELPNGNKPSKPVQTSSFEPQKQTNKPSAINPPTLTAPVNSVPLTAPVNPAALTATVNPADAPNNSDPNVKKERKRRHKKNRSKKDATQNGNSLNSLAGEVAKARQHIKNSLQCIDDIANMTSPSAVVEVSNRLNAVEKENAELRIRIGDLTALLSKLEVRVNVLEKAAGTSSTVAMQTSANNTHAASQAVINNANVGSQATAAVKTAGSQSKPTPKKDDDDDGVDLFASDSEEEDAEASKIREQRLAEYAAKKSKKPALIAKSSIILDVKPWDDETDMKAMEEQVRKITADGLLWGASKLVPLAYGIHKLQINCVVEDDKISIDWLQETIEEIEDYVQSVDIAAFNKI